MSFLDEDLTTLIPLPQALIVWLCRCLSRVCVRVYIQVLMTRYLAIPTHGCCLCHRLEGLGVGQSYSAPLPSSTNSPLHALSALHCLPSAFPSCTRMSFHLEQLLQLLCVGTHLHSVSCSSSASRGLCADGDADQRGRDRDVVMG